MYDNHVYCKEYRELKDRIADIVNCGGTDEDIDEIRERIQELYENGEIQATQYDNLMGYLIDLG